MFSFGAIPMRAIVPLLSMNDAAQNRLIWLDLEMTGLDPDNDSILEIATIVTDADLNEIAEGPVFAIRHSEAVLGGMDDWNTEHHTASGLWQRVLESETDLKAAEQSTLDFLARWTEPGTSPLCGNSICQDRRFLYRLMPDLEAWFHYRNLDVSTIKELAARWAPALLENFTKQNRHEALADIRDSIAELRHYRPHLGVLSGCK
jgi:oligoribonuclease